MDASGKLKTFLSARARASKGAGPIQNHFHSSLLSSSLYAHLIWQVNKFLTSCTLFMNLCTPSLHFLSGLQPNGGETRIMLSSFLSCIGPAIGWVFSGINSHCWQFSSYTAVCGESRVLCWRYKGMGAGGRGGEGGAGGLPHLNADVLWGRDGSA